MRAYIIGDDATLRLLELLLSSLKEEEAAISGARLQEADIVEPEELFISVQHPYGRHE